MGKLFTTSDDIVEVIENKFNETGLASYGLTLKIMSVKKSKELLKVSKASAATEFLTKKDGIIQVFVYEAAFDRLTDKVKDMMVEMALSNISYDVDKDKIIIENNPFKQVIAMRQKFGNDILDSIELTSITIDTIEEEEKERKLAEKENKKMNKNSN